MFWPFSVSRRKEVVREGPFPPEWMDYLEENVLLYRRLPEAAQARLRDALQTFIAEKHWEGCQGLEVTEEMQVTIAAQACLLALGWEGYHFDRLKTVLIYPGSYLATAQPEESDEVDWRLGEAHHRGPVVLSWWHARWDSRQLGEGNLVLHEFAHKLADLGDWETGMPETRDPSITSRWEEVVAPEYDQLVEATDYGRPTLLDAYGATNRAEFFAVATECFFLQPIPLRTRHVALYRLLADVYCQDPARWPALNPESRARAESAWEEYQQHALAECAAAIRLKPDYAHAYRSRADCYWRLGDYAKALADYSEVIRLTEGDERADAYCDRGLTHQDAGNLAEAIADFGLALQMLPSSRDAFRRRGVAHALAGNPEQALSDLTRAIRLDPGDDAAYLERGRVFARRKDYPRALHDFQKAIRLCPQWEQPYQERAALYLEMGEPTQALGDCEVLLRLYPEFAEAYRLRAEVFAALGEEEKARQDRARADKLENPGTSSG